MNISLILAHPDYKSFNHAIAAVALETLTEIKIEMAVFGDPLETLWKNCIFGLCGVDKFYRKMFTMVVISSEAQRKTWLEEVRQTVSDCFPSSE